MARILLFHDYDLSRYLKYSAVLGHATRLVLPFLINWHNRSELWKIVLLAIEIFFGLLGQSDYVRLLCKDKNSKVI